MKKMQTAFLKIMTLIILTLLPALVPAQSLGSLLNKADSLFAKKQFTQSFDLYQRLHTEGEYSAAMFLKMAYIQEGLNKPGLALYYLNLYYLASADRQALHKMEELATKHQLSGYESTPMQQAEELLAKRKVPLVLVFGCIAILLTALAIRQKRKGSRPVALAVFTAIWLLGLAWFINFFEAPQAAIVVSNNTLVMNAPAAGASVIGVLGDGNKVLIAKQADAWIKIYWDGKPAYIRHAQVKELAL
ncbi:MAG: hypothetical protein KF775_13360 [Cyclobacteriaceae bacterium]|nr:hypothetical protein [Cyclobacteriaceae bacterium]